MSDNYNIQKALERMLSAGHYLLAASREAMQERTRDLDLLSDSLELFASQLKDIRDNVIAHTELRDIPQYKSQAARDARQGGYGTPDYWKYLDEQAKEHAEYCKRQGKPELAEQMFTRSLTEALIGNDGI